jgi:hypothetical protein
MPFTIIYNPACEWGALQIVAPLFDCGRWGHSPRLTALAGVLTSQRQLYITHLYLLDNQ